MCPRHTRATCQPNRLQPVRFVQGGVRAHIGIHVQRCALGATSSRCSGNVWRRRVLKHSVALTQNHPRTPFCVGGRTHEKQRLFLRLLLLVPSDVNECASAPCEYGYCHQTRQPSSQTTTHTPSTGVARYTCKRSQLLNRSFAQKAKAAWCRASRCLAFLCTQVRAPLAGPATIVTRAPIAQHGGKAHGNHAATPTSSCRPIISNGCAKQIVTASDQGVPSCAAYAKPRQVKHVQLRCLTLHRHRDCH